MEIRIPKPDIKCPKCGQKINDFLISGHTFDNIEIKVDCIICGHCFNLDVVFEDDPLFCNCEICKQLNLIKDEV